MGFYFFKIIMGIDNDSDRTIKYVSHFSHNGNALQDYIESVAKPYGINVAFDGEEVEF